jgi:hypothetical protein
MTELEYKVYLDLKSSDLRFTQIPSSVRGSLLFKNLQLAKIIDTRKSGRGSTVYVRERVKYDSFFSQHFSEVTGDKVTKAANIQKLRNSKVR